MNTDATNLDVGNESTMDPPAEAKKKNKINPVGQPRAKAPAAEIPAALGPGGEEEIHYCTKHNARMTQLRGTKKDAPHKVYSCKVPGCDARSVVIKHDIPAPREPMECPPCLNAKRTIEGGPVYLEVNHGKSTAFQLRMECPHPNCSFQVSVQRPSAAAQLLRRNERPAQADIIDSVGG